MPRDMKAKRKYDLKYKAVHKERLTEQKKRWRINNLERCKEQKKGYREANKEKIHVEAKKYREDNKEQIAAYYKEYIQTPEGKGSKGKQRSKRRQLGFIPLNEPFEGCEAHHISQNFVIYMPKELHQALYHNIWTWHNMEQMNKLAIECL